MSEKIQQLCQLPMHEKLRINKNNWVSSFQFFLFVISWPLYESKVYISHVFMKEFIVFKTS